MLDQKTQKYDRQLRLWAASGQEALENSRICLINGTATGTEILKNLVLPGIGHVTIVDGERVDESNSGNNFFVDESRVGESRARSTTDLLKELNENVDGNSVEEDASNFIANQPDFFRQFQMVVATELPERSVLRLAELCWSAGVPFVNVKTCGFIGYFRIVAPEHCILETHPENTADLRLDKPFPLLREVVSKIGDFDAMDSHLHAHIPYAVILLRYLEEWKASHGGAMPTTREEKNELRNIVRSGARSDDEENFQEAVAAVPRICNETKIPSSTRDIFNDPKCSIIRPESPNFWILARAIKDFASNEGQGSLPLTGVVPDMKADTNRYIDLQNAYVQQAREHVAQVRSRVETLLESVGRPKDAISCEEIETACKHAGVMKVVRYRSMAEEYSKVEGAHKGKEIGRALDDPDSNAVQYVLFRACDLFQDRHGRYPGVRDEEVDGDFDLLKEYVGAVLTRSGLSPFLATKFEDHIREFCRAGHSEHPAVAALMGGLVAQEIIKLLTRQYIPINNTCIFNGIRSTTSTFAF